LPAHFSISSPLDLVDGVVRVAEPGKSGTNGAPEVSEYVSPFQLQQGDSSQLIDFCDRTTTLAQATIEGRINVLLAPREVLLGIPGLSPEQVDQILNARTQDTADAATRRHAVWLLTEGLIDRATMQRIWPYVTVSGDIVQAQIVAFYDAESPWSRQQVIIDGTAQPPTLVYCRDLGRLGRGFRIDQLRSPHEPLSAELHSPDAPPATQSLRSSP
jgi:hypothetical protein